MWQCLSLMSWPNYRTLTEACSCLSVPSHLAHLVAEVTEKIQTLATIAPAWLKIVKTAQGTFIRLIKTEKLDTVHTLIAAHIAPHLA
jgi:hypothetical protein